MVHNKTNCRHEGLSIMHTTPILTPEYRGQAINRVTKRTYVSRKTRGEHMQWFYFRVDGARNAACTLRIINAGDASYPKAWDGYRVCTSVDRHTWTRADTRYENGVLIIEHQPESQMQWYAYFAPHPRTTSRVTSNVSCRILVSVDHSGQLYIGTSIDSGRGRDPSVLGDRASASR